MTTIGIVLSLAFWLAVAAILVLAVLATLPA